MPEHAYRDAHEMVVWETLERELGLLRAAAAGSLSGIFGPQPMSWRINREAAIFLGAGRALLLQLAHPWIAAAIKKHSETFANPIGRFHRTFSTVFTMVFGTLEQSLVMLQSRYVALGGRTVSGRLLLLRERGERAALGSRDTVAHGTRRPHARAARPHAR